MQMQVHHSSLSLSAPRTTCDNVVPVGMTLEQVVDRIRFDGPGHILVVHDDGSLAGVLTTEELLLRMSAADGVERLKWSRRPIESILAAVITPAVPSPQPANGQPGPSTNWDCTAYLHQGRLQAVTTDDDVLLSWRSIEPFLLILSSVFVPLYGVILGRLASTGPAVTIAPLGAGSRKVDPIAAAIWVGGIVLYHALAKWAPQFGSALPTLVATFALALAARGAARAARADAPA